MLKLDENVSDFDYYKTVIQFNQNSVISGDKKKYLIDTQFKAMSIQALMFKRELIGENHLKMVEGAVGEDTLFFHELLLHAEKVKAMNLNIHIYYAAVSGSTVNTISKKFFERYYLLEIERYSVFSKQQILKEYLEKRFEYYFKNWYLEKLKRVHSDDAIESIRVLHSILDIY